MASIICRVLLNGSNQGALFMKILKGKYPAVKGYGARLTEVLDRCLATSTARRFDTKAGGAFRTSTRPT